jgi:hypothetical protein
MSDSRCSQATNIVIGQSTRVEKNEISSLLEQGKFS